MLKRIMIPLFVALMGIAIVGCGGEDDPTPQSSDQGQIDETPYTTLGFCVVGANGNETGQCVNSYTCGLRNTCVVGRHATLQPGKVCGYTVNINRCTAL